MTTCSDNALRRVWFTEPPARKRTGRAGYVLEPTQKQLAREAADRDLDAGQCDEGGKGHGEVFPVPGEAAITAEPRESSLDDQRRGIRNDGTFATAVST